MVLVGTLIGFQICIRFPGMFSEGAGQEACILIAQHATNKERTHNLMDGGEMWPTCC